MSLFHFTSLKESNVDEIMKNVNVQREVDDYQKNEKIEDLYPHVGTSTGEDAPIICLVFGPGTWDFWMNVFSTK